METLTSRILDYIYQKWIISGWKLITGVAIASVIAWFTHPYVALYAYEQGYVGLYDNSWTLTLLAAIQVVIFLGILGMMAQLLFTDPKPGKTKFKRK